MTTSDLPDLRVSETPEGPIQPPRVGRPGGDHLRPGPRAGRVTPELDPGRPRAGRAGAGAGPGSARLRNNATAGQTIRPDGPPAGAGRVPGDGGGRSGHAGRELDGRCARGPAGGRRSRQPRRPDPHRVGLPMGRRRPPEPDRDGGVRRGGGARPRRGARPGAPAALAARPGGVPRVPDGHGPPRTDPPPTSSAATWTWLPSSASARTSRWRSPRRRGRCCGSRGGATSRAGRSTRWRAPRSCSTVGATGTSRPGSPRPSSLATPSWRGRILTDVGHAPQMETPGRWVTEVAAWLAERR